MLLNGGQWNGARLLSRKSVELMTDNAIGNLNLANFSETGLTLEQTSGATGLGWACGSQEHRRERVAGSPGDYGWGGAYGTYFWVDPKEQLIGIVLMGRAGIVRTEFPTGCIRRWSTEPSDRSDRLLGSAAAPVAAARRQRWLHPEHETNSSPTALCLSAVALA